MGIPTDIGHHREGRFIALFVIILACHMALPIMRQLAWVNVLFGLGFVVLLGVAGWITVEAPGWRRAYFGLMVISLASTASLMLIETTWGVLWLGYHAAFVTLIAVLVTRWTILREQVTSDTIFAALSGYYLLGFAWGLIYALIDTINPGSFTVDLSTKLEHAFYFSFVTITTLGFGDISPATPLTRALVTSEALIGQIYLVVLIARLVALRTETKAE